MARHVDELVYCEQTTMTNVAEKLKCAERELKTMESIADDYRELAAQLHLPIFDE